jgi:murein DD-endopeptidase MepM/ murein hydrolase activator NlpD
MVARAAARNLAGRAGGDSGPLPARATVALSMTRWLLFALPGLLACATPAPPPKIPFAEASRSGAPAPAGPASDLESDFDRFLVSVGRGRMATPAGAAMPAAHAAAWGQLLDAIDARLAGRASTLVLTRARLRLEEELQADARAFGDFPGELAQRASDTVRRLSARIVTQTTRARRVDPARFRWPVDPVVVSSPYGLRHHPIADEPRFHAGIDLEAPRAHPVLAAEDATVVFAAWNGAHGKQVELQHDPNWATRYSHLDALLVKSGARVKKGQVIGLVGQTGLATGPHLHFELRRDGDALDPEVFLRAPGTPLYSGLLP